MGTQGVLSLWIIWLVCACNVGVSDGRYTLGVRREGDPAIWATTWSQQQQQSKRAGIRGVKVKSQASERAALLAFKQTLSSTDAVKLASWSAGTDHCDGTWAGIQCLSSRPRRVYLIDLSGLGLQFTLSNLNLAAYPALQVLWLSENVVTGSLDIFAAQGSFGALTELRMQDTGLTGTLPRSLPAKLRKLHLQSNQLSGSLPAELPVAAPELEVLLLSTNNLQGTIPDTWSEFTKLKTISLDNNPSLTGCIPAWVKSFLIGSSRPAATANGAAPAVAAANTQMCGLCGSLLCNKVTTEPTTSAAAVPAASTVTILQPPSAVNAPTAAAAAPNSVSTPAASADVTQPAAGDAAQAGPAVSAAAAATTLVPPPVAADAPATPPATAAPASTGVAADTTMPAAAAPAAVATTTIPVPPPLPITLTPTTPAPPAAAAAAPAPAAAEVPAVAAPQAAAAATPAAGAPAIAAAAPSPSALPAANTAALPAITPAAPSAGVAPAAQAAPAIVPVPGTAVVPPQQSTPPTGGAASANGPATPIDPALTVIDGKNRKPTYI